MGLRRRPRRRWVGALVHAGTGEGGFETRPGGKSGKWRREWVPACGDLYVTGAFRGSRNLGPA